MGRDWDWEDKAVIERSARRLNRALLLAFVAFLIVADIWLLTDPAVHVASVFIAGLVTGGTIMGAVVAYWIGWYRSPVRGARPR